MDCYRINSPQPLSLSPSLPSSLPSSVCAFSLLSTNQFSPPIIPNCVPNSRSEPGPCCRGHRRCGSERAAARSPGGSAGGSRSVRSRCTRPSRSRGPCPNRRRAAAKSGGRPQLSRTRHRWGGRGGGSKDKARYTSYLPPSRSLVRSA